MNQESKRGREIREFYGTEKKAPKPGTLGEFLDFMDKEFPAPEPPPEIFPFGRPAPWPVDGASSGYSDLSASEIDRDNDLYNRLMEAHGRPKSNQSHSHKHRKGEQHEPGE